MPEARHPRQRGRRPLADTPDVSTRVAARWILSGCGPAALGSYREPFPKSKLWSYKIVWTGTLADVIVCTILRQSCAPAWSKTTVFTGLRECSRRALLF